MNEFREVGFIFRTDKQAQTESLDVVRKVHFIIKVKFTSVLWLIISPQSPKILPVSEEKIWNNPPSTESSWLYN